MIDDPAENDNRDYDYTNHEPLQRGEYPVFLELVSEGATVIDFGCGDGALLHLLRQRKQTCGIGYDRSRSGIKACRDLGLEARCAAIDQFHPELSDKQFDYALCNVTLQMVMYPERLLAEMTRVACRQIISFPNFAFYKNRLEMVFQGRMPQAMLGGYSWYATGHIHQLSLRDFEALLTQVGGLRILKRKLLNAAPSQPVWKRALIQRFPNVLGVIPIYLLETR